jgi:hypothetical protein
MARETQVQVSLLGSEFAQFVHRDDKFSLATHVDSAHCSYYTLETDLGMPRATQ